jgi:serine/threonine protein kinase
MQQARQIDDDLLMNLMERALALPKDGRHTFLLNKCRGDNALLDQLSSYIHWEERMGRFLLEPVFMLPKTDWPLKPGQILIRRFKILREVGKGGRGIIWEAMDQKLDRRVAIKCAKAGFGKQLPLEVRHARDINHPNVCKIYEVHTASTLHGEIHFISMEFVEGETLSERLRATSLTEKERSSIARQLCAGVSEAHRNNIIHGGLESNNVILTRGPDASIRAVIMDFGFARIPNVGRPKASDDVLVETLAHGEPVPSKSVQPSVATDIYALGVILWELASGRAAADFGLTSKTFPWHERPARKAPKGYGKWDRILARSLEVDPARRFQSVDELATALGNPTGRGWLLAAAVAAVLAIVSGPISYQRPMAPAETVRLAMLPFSSELGDPAISEKLFRDTASRLARAKANQKTRFILIQSDKILYNGMNSWDKSRSARGTTYVLHGVLERQPKSIKVRAYLTDMRSGVNAMEWDADYAPEQMRYAPIALASVVTDTIHLPIAKYPQ